MLPRSSALPWLFLSALGAAPAAAQSPAAFEYLRDAAGWVRVGPEGSFRVHPSVVSLRFAAPEETLASFRARLSGSSPESAALLGRLVELRANRLGVRDLRVGEGDDVLEVVALLRASGLVDFAEENTLGEYVGLPSDPGFAQQWALRNTGQTGGTSGADVDAELAWDTSTGLASVVVAVLDSGTEISHPDLAANTWTNPGEVPGNGQDDDGNGFIDDYYGWDFWNGNSNVEGPYYHGTAVTGIISAATGNGVGMSGLAGGWNGAGGCRTLAVGVGDNFPDGSILDDAVLYAVDHGARVITMSLSVGQSSALDAALDLAWNQADVFVDCAAGNGSGSVAYPANHPSVLSVPATDHDDERASWSNSGPENWVAAPGVDVYTTSTGGGYTTTSGTSFAAPYLAAGAALVYSVLPATSNESVKEILRLTADDILQSGFDNGSGWGRLNAAAAVAHALANDCNQNGVYDAEDLSSGASTDGNGNGVPDECECAQPTTYCVGAPNSVGAGARIGFAGGNSAAANDLVLQVTGAAASQLGIFYYGSAPQQVAFGEGVRCVSGATFRLPLVPTDAFGDASYALDLTSPPQPAGQIQAGDVWYFQFWYRDPLGGGSNFNLSDGLEVPFCP